MANVSAAFLYCNSRTEALYSSPLTSFLGYSCEKVKHKATYACVFYTYYVRMNQPYLKLIYTEGFQWGCYPVTQVVYATSLFLYLQNIFVLDVMYVWDHYRA